MKMGTPSPHFHEIGLGLGLGLGIWLGIWIGLEPRGLTRVCGAYEILKSWKSQLDFSDFYHKNHTTSVISNITISVISLVISISEPISNVAISDFTQ